MAEAEWEEVGGDWMSFKRRTVWGSRDTIGADGDTIGADGGVFIKLQVQWVNLIILSI